MTLDQIVDRQSTTERKTRSVIVISKESTFELYQNSPDKEVRDYLLADPAEAARLKASHDAHYASLQLVRDTLASKPQYVARTVARKDLDPNTLRTADIIVSVGGDGTVIDIGHYCGKVPVLGINSDPKNSVGFLCSATAANIDNVLANLDTVPHTTLATIQPFVDGSPTAERAINDIAFTHNNPAGMTRYEIITPHYEKRKDGGLIVCTATGSSAWMYNIGGELMPLHDLRLQYRPREIRDARSQFAQQVSLISRTRDARLYVDLQHIHYDVTLGQRIELVPGEPLTLIGNLRRE